MVGQGTDDLVSIIQSASPSSLIPLNLPLNFRPAHFQLVLVQQPRCVKEDPHSTFQEVYAHLISNGQELGSTYLGMDVAPQGCLPDDHVLYEEFRTLGQRLRTIAQQSGATLHASTYHSHELQ